MALSPDRRRRKPRRPPSASRRVPPPRQRLAEAGVTYHQRRPTLECVSNTPAQLRPRYSLPQRRPRRARHRHAHLQLRFGAIVAEPSAGCKVLKLPSSGQRGWPHAPSRFGCSKASRYSFVVLKSGRSRTERPVGWLRQFLDGSGGADQGCVGMRALAGCPRVGRRAGRGTSCRDSIQLQHSTHSAREQ